MAAVDEKRSAAQKEAFVLLSLAKSLLDIDPDKALENASQASNLFKKAGDTVGAADSFRLVLSAHRMKADLLKIENDSSEEAKKLYKEVDQLAKNMLESARGTGDKRTQAAMLLSLAENCWDRRGAKKREEALKCVHDAQALLKQVSDAKLESDAYLLQAKVLYKKREVSTSIKMAHVAITLFQSIKDKVGEAECWHLIGACHFQEYKKVEAVSSGEKAIELYQAAGDSRGCAREHLGVARWRLHKSDAEGALVNATAAYDICLENKLLKGPNMEMLSLYVECLCVTGRACEAVKVARQAERRSKENGARDQVHALKVLAEAHAYIGDMRSAEETLETALSLANRAGNKHLEIEVAKIATPIYLAARNYDRALAVAERCKECWKDLGCSKQEALQVMHGILKVNMESRNFKKAMASADEALRMVETSGDTVTEAYALLANSTSFFALDETEKALTCAQEAAELFRESGEKEAEALALTQASKVQTMTHNYKAAMITAGECLDIHEAVGDGAAQAKTLYQMGLIHLSDQRHKDAIDLLVDGLKIAKSLDDYSTSAKLLVAIVESYVAIMEQARPQSRAMKENSTIALKYGKEAVKVTAQTFNLALEADAHYLLANVYLMTGKIGDLMETASAASSLYRQSDNTSGQVRSRMFLAKGWIVKGKLAKATNTLEEALELAAHIGDSDLETQISALLREAESAETVVASDVHYATTAATTQAPGGTPAAPEAASAAARGSAVQVFKGPDPEVVRSRISAMVVDMTGTTDTVDQDTPFMDSGIDSLASVELRTGLQTTFGVPLPSTVMFNFPTTAAITNFIVSEMTEREISLK